MRRTHSHPCRYCESPLPCVGDPVYADGLDGAFCSEEVTHGLFVCDDCHDIIWCGMCGEIEALPGEALCPACVDDDHAL